MELKTKDMERQMSKSFRDLIVWQKAHQLVLDTYKLTRAFPQEEMHCLTSQMRRSVISVAANVAEGFKKRGRNSNFYILNS